MVNYDSVAGSRKNSHPKVEMQPFCTDFFLNSYVLSQNRSQQSKCTLKILVSLCSKWMESNILIYIK